MKQKSRIYMVGFMGSGKTYLGKKLARALDYHFIDLDEEFESRSIMTINEYFDRIGEDAFRIKEAEILRLHYRTECVYATGGGAPCHHDNMSWMNRFGVTIFLNPPVSVLLERLHRIKDERPLLKNLSGEKMQTYVADLLESRKVYYKQSDIIVNEEEASVSSLVNVLRDFEV